MALANPPTQQRYILIANILFTVTPKPSTNMAATTETRFGAKNIAEATSITTNRYITTPLQFDADFQTRISHAGIF